MQTRRLRCPALPSRKLWGGLPLCRAFSAVRIWDCLPGAAPRVRARLTPGMFARRWRSGNWLLQNHAAVRAPAIVAGQSTSRENAALWGSLFGVASVPCFAGPGATGPCTLCNYVIAGLWMAALSVPQRWESFDSAHAD